ncbi:MAG: carboxypeptidase M32 [Proteobacteria bacterium]|nr:carboxypeptidase M32 [Pseudomonadota bacterium]
MTGSKAAQAYEQLKYDFAQMNLIGQTMGKTVKDAETHMPKGSAATFEKQYSALGMAIHRIISDPRLADRLDEAEAGAGELSLADRRNLELMRHQWIHKASLPTDLAQTINDAVGSGQTLHQEYYKSGDWGKMQGQYKKSFGLMREAGAAKLELLKKYGISSVYEALLDQYNPGLREKDIDGLFGPLATHLPGMIQEAVEKQKNAGAPIPLRGGYSDAAQEKLCRMLLAAIGFDFDHGRFDIIKGHPSSGGAPDDEWLTARTDESDFTPAIYAGIHEGGHGLYEQGLPTTWRDQPAGNALGMDVHESQSRIIEVQAGLTPEFIGWLSRQAATVFGTEPALETANLQKILHTVNPTFIRVEADEMTYPMHVILRTELEKAIIEGNLDVADLPDAWNEKMVRYLGIRPPGNEKGCMQDVHWPTLAVGYFPAYTFGDDGAVLFFASALKQYPDIIPNLAEGDFALLKKWIGDNVHSKGSLLTTAELFRTATGQERTAQAYLNHLSRRYLDRPFAPQP